MDKKGKFVWVDLEMTGLNVKKNKILEVSVVITDEFLELITQPLSIIVKTTKKDIENAEPWPLEHFTTSGLIDQSLKSKVTYKKAESIIFDLIAKNCVEKECFLAGSSVHVDGLFLSKYMPKIIDYLHYRILDVSSIKIIKNFWYPKLKKFKREETHRAEYDILNSIEELKYYRDNLFT